METGRMVVAWEWGRGEGEVWITGTNFQLKDEQFWGSNYSLMIMVNNTVLYT